MADKEGAGTYRIGFAGKGSTYVDDRSGSYKIEELPHQELSMDNKIEELPHQELSMKYKIEDPLHQELTMEYKNNHILPRCTRYYRILPDTTRHYQV